MFFAISERHRLIACSSKLVLQASAKRSIFTLCAQARCPSGDGLCGLFAFSCPEQSFSKIPSDLVQMFRTRFFFRDLTVHGRPPHSLLHRLNILTTRFLLNPLNSRTTFLFVCSKQSTSTNVDILWAGKLNNSSILWAFKPPDSIFILLLWDTCSFVDQDAFAWCCPRLQPHNLRWRQVPAVTWSLFLAEHKTQTIELPPVHRWKTWKLAISPVASQGDEQLARSYSWNCPGNLLTPKHTRDDWQTNSCPLFWKWGKELVLLQDPGVRGPSFSKVPDFDGLQNFWHWMLFRLFTVVPHFWCVLAKDSFCASVLQQTAEDLLRKIETLHTIYKQEI